MTNLTISTTVAQEVTSPALEARAGQITATSLQVAEHFQKRHTNVIRAIRNLEVSDEFGRLNFEPSTYLNEQGKKQPMYQRRDKRMNGLPYIEISAALMGVIGTLLLAGRSRLAGWGFVAYLVSNAGWLVFSWDQSLWALFAQQLVFTVCSLYGVWTWLVRPALGGPEGGAQ